MKQLGQELEGKVAAVTGGAFGIGLASVEGMLATGAQVIAIDRNEKALNALADKHGHSFVPMVLDLLNPHICASLMTRILEKTDRLDIFHANAGLYIGRDFMDTDGDAIDTMLQFNINAVMKNVHAVLEHMIERGTGDIIVTSSLAAHYPPLGNLSMQPPSGLSTVLSRPFADRSINTVSVSVLFHQAQSSPLFWMTSRPTNSWRQRMPVACLNHKRSPMLFYSC